MGSQAEVCYFAYGSNMDPIEFRKCIGGRKHGLEVQQNDIYRAPGELKGWKIYFCHADDCYPEDEDVDVWAADPNLTGICSISRDTSSTVYGVVYWVEGNVFDTLDKHEGTTYSREKLKVQTTIKEKTLGVGEPENSKFIETSRKSGEVECWVYVGHSERQETHRKPTKRYMDMLLAGADCLPNRYVEMLRQVETLH
ncbi:hypothetical protein ACHWQZ_G017081 [Mnemiopsis leidyi]